MPFHKAQEFGKIPRKIAAEPAPDLEEAFDVSNLVFFFLTNLTWLIDG